MEQVERPWLLRGGVAGLAMVVGIFAWLAAGDGDEAAAPVEAEPRIVAAGELGDVAAAGGYPVYWAGSLPGASLELTESGDGVQVRYLEGGAGPGEAPADFLTIGTYPLADPAAALDTFAAEPGSIVRSSRTGRRVVTSTGKPTSVYFASPDNSVQVEVYDPSPRRALRLALSEQVRPVEP